MRKPNYDFERSQRSKAKEIKAQLKAQKKQEKAANADDAAPPEGEAVDDEESGAGRG